MNREEEKKMAKKDWKGEVNGAQPGKGGKLGQTN